MMYCEDCQEEVEISISRDSIGDYDVIGGVYEFEVWTCSECGGENLLDEAPEKQMADPAKDRPSAQGLERT